jgi:histidinol-phosphate/aromatic aminotransferase/cobyric acid decarboxylase-like protein
MSEEKQIWDSNTQTFHGGQDWRLVSNYKEDFSVTTNPLGIPKKALEAAIASLQTIQHYPAADFEPALSLLAKWLVPNKDVKSRFTLGNGASELIDLITRSAPAGPWRPGSTFANNHPVQYREYQRAAEAHGRHILHPTDKEVATISAIINPCNPTGDYLPVEQMKKYIETHCADNSYVLIDESMLPWEGPNWRENSLTTCHEWVEKLLKERNIAVWILHSWTKIWACPGIRIGSVLAPSEELMVKIKRIQVPWSLNTAALAFIETVVHENDYMQQTWDVTTQWREHTVEWLKKRHPAWTVHGQKWTSWLWIDTHDDKIAEKAQLLAKQAGVPVRWGQQGYESPSFVRIAVRSIEAQQHLIKAWETLEQH